MAGKAKRKVQNSTLVQKRYDIDNTQRVSLKFNLRHDADILRWLNAQPSKQGAIKTAIRDHIANNQQISSVVD